MRLSDALKKFHPASSGAMTMLALDSFREYLKSKGVDEVDFPGYWDWQDIYMSGWKAAVDNAISIAKEAEGGE